MFSEEEIFTTAGHEGRKRNIKLHIEFTLNIVDVGVHHRGTENTKGAQRKAVFLRAPSVFSVPPW